MYDNEMRFIESLESALGFGVIWFRIDNERCGPTLVARWLPDNRHHMERHISRINLAQINDINSYVGCIANEMRAMYKKDTVDELKELPLG
jgi:hypothetical protein